MRGHGAAVIAALMQDGIGPEIGHLGLMRGPIGDMHGKDRAKAGMFADGGVEFRHDPLNLGAGDVEPGWQGVAHTPRDALAPERIQDQTLFVIKTFFVIVLQMRGHLIIADGQFPMRD